jgi:hypothetical protein
MFPIFPAGGLAYSVTTTVWLGVWVTCFYNLRFGWVLSGLVVPGYLVPLLIGKPLSACVIVVEAVITYFLVWGYSEYLSRLRLWNGFFGRDRFFALLVVSILVRIVMDMLLLPALGEYIIRTFHLTFDYRNNLHSFGLIVVALLANQFWKPGFKNGILPVFVSIATTWLLVRYGLMTLTNFNMGNILYMYEDIATSMLASPKAYIIVLTTALVASRMNLRYGWDFSGILIPSLLALQWYQPLKLLVTFTETFVILGVAVIILRLPLLRNANMEGARKILLFFNIGFIYKLLLGWAMIRFMPHLNVSDYYGFGYLLTTLLAIKMHDKDIAIRVTRATLQTSLLAVILAGGIGFALTRVPNVVSLTSPSHLPQPSSERNFSGKRLADVLKKDKVALYQSLQKNSFVPPLPRDLEIFGEALKYLRQYVLQRRQNDSSDQPLSTNILQEAPALLRAAGLLSMLDYRMGIIEERYLYLYEIPPGRGWGTYVINLQAKTGLLMEIPAPFDEWGTLEAGGWMFVADRAAALAVAGAGRYTNDNRTSDVLRNQSTLFTVFHRAFGHGNVLQIRSYTPEMVRILTGKRPSPMFTGESGMPSMLWVKDALPPDLNLPQLEALVDEYQIHWGPSPFPNMLRDTTRQGFAELMMNRRDARNIMFRAPFSGIQLDARTSRQSIAGYLQDWLLKTRGQFAEKGSNLYVPPELEELLYFDHEILTPLVHLIKTQYTHGGWTTEGHRELRVLNLSAAVMGYEIVQYHHEGTGHDYVILAERKDLSTRRFQGTYVFRLGAHDDFLVQAPRTLSEINVFEYAVSLFERLNAFALMISTAHPLANTDGSADVIHPDNKENLFNLVNQVILRELQNVPLLVVQCRARRYRPETPLNVDALIALRSGLKMVVPIDPLTRRLRHVLETDGLSVKMVDGSLATAGYEVGTIPQAGYLDYTENKEFAKLWLDPLLRAHFRQQTENTLQARQFSAMKIVTVEDDLTHYLRQYYEPMPPERVLRALEETVTRYLKTHNIVILYDLLARWPQMSYTRLIDMNSKQSFLLIADHGHHLLLAVNLFPREMAQTVTIKGRQVRRETIADFVASGAARLKWEAF